MTFKIITLALAVLLNTFWTLGHTHIQKIEQQSEALEITKYFLKAANNSSSNVYKILEKTREELSSGFIKKDKVIPLKLMQHDLKIIRLAMFDERKFVGDETHSEFEGQYSATYGVFVEARSIYYGGHAQGIVTLQFKCTKETTDLNNPQTSTISCSYSQEN